MACIELQKVNGVATAIIVDGVVCPLPPAVVCEPLPAAALPIACPPDATAMGVAAQAWVQNNGTPNTLYTSDEFGAAVLACGNGVAALIAKPTVEHRHAHLDNVEIGSTIVEVVPGRHYRQVFANGAEARILLDGRMTLPTQFPTGGTPGVRWFTDDVDVTTFSIEMVKLPASETPNGCKAINALSFALNDIDGSEITLDGQWQDPANFNAVPYAGGGAGWRPNGGLVGLPPQFVTGGPGGNSWINLVSHGAIAGDHLTGVINNQDARQAAVDAANDLSAVGPQEGLEVNVRLKVYEPVDVWTDCAGSIICVANANGVALPASSTLIEGLSCGSDGGNDVAVVSNVVRSASGQMFSRNQHTSINYDDNVSGGHPGQLITPGAWRTILFDPARTDVNSDDSTTLGASAVAQISQGILVTTAGHGVYSLSLQVWIDADPTDNIQTQFIRFNSPFQGTSFSERVGTAGTSFLSRSYEINARQGIEFAAQIRLFNAPATIQFAQFKLTKVNEAIGYP